MKVASVTQDATSPSSALESIERSHGAACLSADCGDAGEADRAPVLQTTGSATGGAAEQADQYVDRAAGSAASVSSRKPASHVATELFTRPPATVRTGKRATA